MKELSLERMANVEGGGKCSYAAGAVLGAWAMGIGAAFAPVSFGASLAVGFGLSLVASALCYDW